MNITEIYNRYHVDTVNFIKFVKESKLEYRMIPNVGFDIREDLAGAYVEAFNKHLEYLENQEKLKAKKEEERKKPLRKRKNRPLRK